MRNITKAMIKTYDTKHKGYDLTGHALQKNDIYTFHHLIVPHRECKKRGLGEGYLEWNGSILCGNTSHPYLHLIEAKDYEIFLAITSEMIDENIKGYLDPKNIRYIDDCLSTFEREHSSDRSRKGKILIKEEYLRRVKL